MPGFCISHAQFADIKTFTHTNNPITLYPPHGKSYQMRKLLAVMKRPNRKIKQIRQAPALVS